MKINVHYSSEHVKEYLKDYFGKSRQAFGRQSDQGLCLLCIQCFEVSSKYHSSC